MTRHPKLAKVLTFLVSVTFVLAVAISYGNSHQPPKPFHSNGVLVHFTE